MGVEGGGGGCGELSRAGAAIYRAARLCKPRRLFSVPFSLAQLPSLACSRSSSLTALVISCRRFRLALSSLTSPR